LASSIGTCLAAPETENPPASALISYGRPRHVHARKKNGTVPPKRGDGAADHDGPPHHDVHESEHGPTGILSSSCQAATPSQRTRKLARVPGPLRPCTARGANRRHPTVVGPSVARLAKGIEPGAGLPHSATFFSFRPPRRTRPVRSSIRPIAGRRRYPSSNFHNRQLAGSRPRRRPRTRSDIFEPHYLVVLVASVFGNAPGLSKFDDHTFPVVRVR